MVAMTEVEQGALEEYIALLVERLGDRLEQVWLFGSAARGDMWGADSPMHSDIDLLVLSTDPLGSDEIEELEKLAYPLFLECGRMIGPAFKPVTSWNEPPSDKDRRLFDRVRAEGRRIWPHP